MALLMVMGRVVLLLLGVTLLVSGRSTRSTAILNPNSPYVLLCGFGLGPGSGSLLFRAKPESHSPFHLALYSLRSDSSLPDFTCSEARNTSSLSLVRFPLTAAPVSLSLPEQKSAHHWSFYLALCNITSETVKIKYTLTVKGTGNTHLTVEEVGLEDWLLPLCVLYGLAALYAGYKLVAAFWLSEDLEGGLFLLAFALLIEVIAIVFMRIDLLRLEEDGKGWVIFRFFALFGDLSVQSFVLILLLCVSTGYYLKSQAFPCPELIVYPSILYLFYLTALLVGDQLSEGRTLRETGLKGGWGKLEIGGKMALLGWTLHMAAEMKGMGEMRRVVGKIRKICCLAYGNTALGYLCGLLAAADCRYTVFLLVSRTCTVLAVTWLLSLLGAEEKYQRVQGLSPVLPSSKTQ